jgi:hypothetical protein
MPPVKQTAIRGSQVLPELYCPESAWSYWILVPVCARPSSLQARELRSFCDRKQPTSDTVRVADAVAKIDL